MTGIEKRLAELIKRLQSAAGANLESVVLYGSAVRDDFSEQYSDLNLFCVLRDVGRTALQQLASTVEWWTQSEGQRPPLFLTESELRASADVFAIETLDIKTSHRLLAGKDVLATIDVPMNLHRLQLEHELRTLVLRLRQHYLLSGEKEGELERVLAKSASSAIVLLRHALIALGHASAADSKAAVLAAGEQVMKLDMSAAWAALDLHDGRRIDTGVIDLYHRYMQLLMAVAERIDAAIPKREWQRVVSSAS
jgi:hypothetical protein